MKIKTFKLDKFGHFLDQSFDFSKGKGIQLLYGPNEAGKSTVLHALRDVLFGIDPRSPYNFIHDYKDIRLSATIENVSGSELAFVRRKGNKNTLLSPDNSVLSESALGAFLGSVDKDEFTRMFGFDHAELRRGGNALIYGEGDAADSLFGRAAGLASILSVSRELKERADKLFTPRRSQEKPFYKAADRRTKAISAIQENTVKTSEWDELLAEIENETLGKRDLEESHGKLRKKEVKSSRSIRVRPIINRIRATKEQIADLGEVPRLREDAIELCKKAFRETEDANADLKRLEGRVKNTKGRVNDLDISDEFLANGAAIEKLFEHGGAILKGREDIPKLETGIEQLRRNIEDGLARLGLTINLSDAKETLPQDGLLSRIRNLASEEGQASERVDQYRRLVERSEQAVLQTEEKISNLPETRDPATLTRVINLARRKADLGTQIKTTENRNREVLQQVNEANASLSIWQGSITELISLQVPLLETVDGFVGCLEELKKEKKLVEDNILLQRTEIKSIETGLDEMVAGNEIPTPEAITAARSHRDGGWRIIKKRYIETDGTIADSELSSFAADSPIAETYETTVRHADLLVDRKEAEAARIARLQELTRSKQKIENSISDSLKHKLELEKHFDKEMTKWQEAWEPSGLAPLSPREMVEWLKKRTEILSDYSKNRDAASELSLSKEELEAAKTSLTQAMIASGSPYVLNDTDDLETLLEYADEHLKDLEQAKADRKANTHDLTRHNKDFLEHTQALEEAQAGMKAWQSDWDTALLELGQANTHRPQDIEPVLNLYEQLRSDVSEQDQLLGRLSGIKRDESAYRNQIDTLINNLTTDQKGAEPVAANKVLYEQLQDMRVAAGKMKTLQIELESVEEERSVQNEKLAEATRLVDTLKAEANCESNEELIAVHERWTEAEGLNSTLRDQLAQLDEAGDGCSYEDLAAEVDTSTLAQDITDKETAEGELGTILEQVSSIGASLSELERRRKEMEKGRGAEYSAQEKEQAVAELRDVSETYMLEMTAHLMLQAAVDRVREARQGPIVASAGKLFSKLTNGSFANLAIDFNENDRPVLRGERMDGARVNVEGMSEGARDQLFLSLRLALVKEYVSTNEPMPFIADDLLLSFDDERAAAALTVLSDLAQESQVLFFTHHSHLVDLAERTIGKSNFTVHKFS